MNVRKSRNMGIVFIICGILIAILSVTLGKWALTACGALIALLGIPYLTGNLFTFDKANKKIIIYALLGPGKKDYPYDSISYENGVVILTRNGAKIRLPLSRGICEKEDWDLFIKEIG